MDFMIQQGETVMNLVFYHVHLRMKLLLVHTEYLTTYSRFFTFSLPVDKIGHIRHLVLNCEIYINIYQYILINVRSSIQ